jgi:hypothetical protein
MRAYNIRVITLLDIYIIHGLVTSGPQRRALAALQKREEKYVLFTLQNRHAPCPLEIRITHAGKMQCTTPCRPSNGQQSAQPIHNKELAAGWSELRSLWKHLGARAGAELAVWRGLAAARPKLWRQYYIQYMLLCFRFFALSSAS